MDEDKNLNPTNEEEESLDQSPNEEIDEGAPIQDDEQEDESQPQGEQDEQEDGEEQAPAPPSRRENLRIQQLLTRIKQQPQPTAQPNTPKGMDYKEKLNADDETIQQLDADRRQYGQSAYEAGIQQAQTIEWRTLLHIDTPQVESRYSFLNSKDKENFHPALASAINEWYLGMSGFDLQSGMVQNPNIRYADFVEGIMEMAEEIAASRVEKTQKNIAKQAANTGLRPDGSQAKRLNLNKAPEDMTDEELDAVLGSLGKK